MNDHLVARIREDLRAHKMICQWCLAHPKQPCNEAIDIGRRIPVCRTWKTDQDSV
jgi:hypothetical protein